MSTSEWKKSNAKLTSTSRDTRTYASLLTVPRGHGSASPSSPSTGTDDKGNHWSFLCDNLDTAIVELMRACETYRDGDGVSQVIERLNRAQDDFKKLSEKLTVERPDENDDDDDDENADITTDINNDLKNERQTSAVSWDIVDEENRPSPSPSRSVRDRLSSRAKSTSPDDKSLQLYRKMEVAQEKHQQHLLQIASKAADELMKVSEHAFIVNESQKAEKMMLEEEIGQKVKVSEERRRAVMDEKKKRLGEMAERDTAVSKRRQEQDQARISRLNQKLKEDEEKTQKAIKMRRESMEKAPKSPGQQKQIDEVLEAELKDILNKYYKKYQKLKKKFNSRIQSYKDPEPVSRAPGRLSKLAHQLRGCIDEGSTAGVEKTLTSLIKVVESSLSSAPDSLLITRNLDLLEPLISLLSSSALESANSDIYVVHLLELLCRLHVNRAWMLQSGHCIDIALKLLHYLDSVVQIYSVPHVFVDDSSVNPIVNSLLACICTLLHDDDVSLKDIIVDFGSCVVTSGLLIKIRPLVLACDCTTPADISFSSNFVSLLHRLTSPLFDDVVLLAPAVFVDMRGGGVLNLLSIVSQPSSSKSPARSLNSSINNAISMPNNTANSPGGAYRESTENLEFGQIVPECLGILLDTMKSLSNLCMIDPVAIQSLITNELNSSEIYHTLYNTLAFSINNSTARSKGDASDESLHLIVKLLGCLCCKNSEFQELMLWGNGKMPNMLQRLCNLPVKYFSTPMHQNVLFPSLLWAIYQNKDARNVLVMELSTEMLLEWLIHVKGAEVAYREGDHPQAQSVLQLDMIFADEKANMITWLKGGEDVAYRESTPTTTV